MSQNRLKAYEIMWVFVFFDLPVVTKRDRKKATGFRKSLEKDGFSMMQYSVYTRHCASRESADVHIKRIRKLVPDKGKVSILMITDKQYGNILNFWGKDSTALPSTPKQLELF